MAESINTVTLEGTVGRSGIKTRCGSGASVCVLFTVMIGDTGLRGQWVETAIPCQFWRDRADTTDDLAPGRVVRLTGKLRRVKKEEHRALVVEVAEVVQIIPS